MGLTFAKRDRVLASGEFTHILRRGSCAADGVLVMFVVAGERPTETRLGVTIPKRTGNAVCRNRWKRLIRESFRTQRAMLPDGFDLVVRPKKGAEPDWVAIQRSVPRLAKKAVARLTSQ